MSQKHNDFLKMAEAAIKTETLPTKDNYLPIVKVLETDSSTVFRRYPNRKIYDSTEKRYVSLQDILVKALSNIKIKVYNEKEEDVSVSTLIQALAIELKDKDNKQSIETLNKITEYIRGGNYE